ncbi:fer-related kinase 1 [Magallana gigas]|uniref:fer-related kinase 1 n=1 Tax=Magallana gigas TaxID=29159 RepID=UPI0033416020
MTTSITFAQDIVRCNLCENPGDHLCRLCQLTLCLECTPKHLSDKGTTHEIVGLTSQTSTDIVTRVECLDHSKSVCEIYCNDCLIPICAKCVIDKHKQHTLVSFDEFLERKKVDILNDIQEMESTVLPEFQKEKTEDYEKDFEKTMRNICVQEDLIFQAVKKAGNDLRAQASKHKADNLEKANQNAKLEKEMSMLIQNARSILERNDPKEILIFKGLKYKVYPCPVDLKKKALSLRNAAIDENDVSSLFGTLLDIEEKSVLSRGENLELQTWFHGFITREEANQLLKKNGDFLVREKTKGTNKNCFVLSTYQNDRLCHIQVSDLLNKISMDHGSTLIDFVEQLLCKGEQTFVKDKHFILRSPVDRSHYQLDYDKIALGQKIETIDNGLNLHRGQFGDHGSLVIHGEERENQIFRYVELLRHLVHPNVVRLKGYSALQKPVLLVIEYMSDSLPHYLRKTGKSISTKQRISMCLHVAKGMAFLHQEKYIHRDLAARNCLVTGDHFVKICGFSMTEKGEVYSSDRSETIPIKWAAPEAFISGNYVLLSDVWSFGILMWEIFSPGMVPYPGMSNIETRDKVIKGYRMEAPKNTPKACYNIMMNCWDDQPAYRSHFVDLIEKLQQLL